MTVVVGYWSFVGKVMEAVGNFVGETNIGQLYVQFFYNDYNVIDKNEHFDCFVYFVVLPIVVVAFPIIIVVVAIVFVLATVWGVSEV